MIKDLVFYKDFLYTAMQNGEIQIWNLNTQKYAGVFPTNEEGLSDLAIWKDKLIALNRDEEQTINFWGINTEKKLFTIESQDFNYADKLIVKEDFLLIQNGGEDYPGFITVWDLKNFKSLGEIYVHKVSSYTFDPESLNIYRVFKNEIQIVNLNEEIIGSIRTKSKIDRLDVSGKYLVGVDESGQVILWNKTNLKLVTQKKLLNNEVRVLIAKSNHLIILLENGQIIKLGLEALNIEFESPSGNHYYYLSNSNGEYLTGVRYAEAIDLWDLKNQKILTQFIDSEERISSASIQYPEVVFGYYSGKIKRFNLVSKELLSDYKGFEEPVTGLLFKEGKLYAGSKNGKIRYWKNHLNPRYKEINLKANIQSIEDFKNHLILKTFSNKKSQIKSFLLYSEDELKTKEVEPSYFVRKSNEIP